MTRSTSSPSRALPRLRRTLFATWLAAILTLSGAAFAVERDADGNVVQTGATIVGDTIAATAHRVNADGTTDPRNHFSSDPGDTDPVELEIVAGRFALNFVDNGFQVGVMFQDSSFAIFVWNQGGALDDEIRFDFVFDDIDFAPDVYLCGVERLGNESCGFAVCPEILFTGDRVTIRMRGTRQDLVDTGNDMTGLGYALHSAFTPRFVNEVLITAPMATLPGCQVTPSEQIGGWIGSAAVTDRTFVPAAGQLVTPDFGSAESQAFGWHDGLPADVADIFLIGNSCRLVPVRTTRSDGLIGFQGPDVFDADIDNALVVASFYVENAGSEPVTLEMALGSDDGVAVRVNGFPVFAHQICRGHTGFTDRFQVTLGPGKNLISAYVWEQTGRYNLCVRFEESGEGVHVPTTLDPTGYDPFAHVAPVGCDRPVVLEEPLADGEVGEAYEITLSAEAESTSLSWRVASGSLPPGLFLEESGTVTGSPRLAGYFSFAVEASSSCVGASLCSAPRSFTISVTDPAESNVRFRRGDINQDEQADISDVLGVLGYLFAGQAGSVESCRDAADANDDGQIDISDAVAILDYLFLGGDAPPAPGPERCGEDPTDDALDCLAARCAPEVSTGLGGILVRSIDLNGQGNSVEVDPDSDVDLVVNYLASNEPSCPDCRRQLVVALEENVIDCAANFVPPLETILGSGSLGFRAPSAPGTYVLYAIDRSESGCGAATALYARSEATPVGSITVRVEDPDPEPAVSCDIQLPWNSTSQVRDLFDSGNVIEALENALASPGDRIKLECSARFSVALIAIISAGGGVTFTAEVSHTSDGFYEIAIATTKADEAGLKIVPDVKATIARGATAKIVFRFRRIADIPRCLENFALALVVHPARFVGLELEALVADAVGELNGLLDDRETIEGILVDAEASCEALEDELNDRIREVNEWVDYLWDFIDDLGCIDIDVGLPDLCFEGVCVPQFEEICPFEIIDDAADILDYIDNPHIESVVARVEWLEGRIERLREVRIPEANLHCENVRAAMSAVLNAISVASEELDAARDQLDLAAEVVNSLEAAQELLQGFAFEIEFSQSANLSAQLSPFAAVSFEGMAIGASGSTTRALTARLDVDNEGRPISMKLTAKGENQGQVIAGLGAGVQGTIKTGLKIEASYRFEGGTYLGLGGKATIYADVLVEGAVGGGVVGRIGAGSNQSLTMDLTQFVPVGEEIWGLINGDDPQVLLDALGDLTITYKGVSRWTGTGAFGVGASYLGYGLRVGASIQYEDVGETCEIVIPFGEAFTLVNLATDAAYELADEVQDALR